MKRFSLAVLVRPRRPRPRRTRGRPRLTVEQLEDRTLLSLMAIGPEFRVNTTTDSSQEWPAASADVRGNMVIVWEGNGPGDTDGIFAQRYDPTGAPVGSEFLVNTTTAYSQQTPAIAMDTNGNFVVVWGNQAGPGVLAQRFNAAGVPQGPEFEIARTAAFPVLPAVAMDSDGDFIVSWDDFFGTDDVYARRYTANGTPRGEPFRVNTTTANTQVGPAVAVDADGDFVVLWEIWDALTEVNGILVATDPDVYGQRYNRDGVPEGNQFRVNSYTRDSQIGPAVVMAPGGDFVVTWVSFGPHARVSSVKAQRYSASGQRQGREFLVSESPGSPWLPEMAMNAKGEFIVVWATVNEPDPLGPSEVFARRYSSAGVPLEPPFHVNTTRAFAGKTAAAIRGDGRFVVAWESEASGDDAGVSACRWCRVGRMPVILVPGILGSTLQPPPVEGLKRLLLRQDTPHPHELVHQSAYNRLLFEFKQQGYNFCDVDDPSIDNLFEKVDCDEDSDLFVATYDWRQPILVNPKNPTELLWDDNPTTFQSGVEYLAWWIDLARQKWTERYGSPDGFIVNIVAHSMGGLLARAYIEQADEAGHADAVAPVARLIMLGTPNHGSVDIYNFWDPSVGSPQDRNRRVTLFPSSDGVLKAMLRDVMKQRALAQAEQLVPSLRDLLPTFPFLSGATPPHNFFLERLNATHGDLTAATKVYLIGTKVLATPVRATLKLQAVPALTFEMEKSGDGRVLYDRSLLLEVGLSLVTDFTLRRIYHGDLPQHPRAICKVFEVLNLVKRSCPRR